MECQPAFPLAIRRVAERFQTPHWLSGTQTHGVGFDVCVAGERLRAPARLYTPKCVVMAHWLCCVGDERVLAACLGTRHHDGFVREACLRRLQHDEIDWVDPFVVALLGDYVIEIAELAAAMVTRLDPDRLAAFARDNPAFFAIVRSRAISYWNCYYRHRFRDYRAYPPVAALDALARRSPSGAVFMPRAGRSAVSRV